MRKNMDIVSFRPGELLGELCKRGDEKQASIVAKQMLVRTLSMLRAEAAKLQRAFSPTEMQVVVGALHHRTEGSDNLADRVEAEIENSGLLRHVVKRTAINTSALSKTLRELGPGAQFAIEDGVAQFRRFPVGEQFGLDGLPLLATLRRLGFVRTSGRPAWGYCLVAAIDTKRQSWTSEFILWSNPDLFPHRPLSDSIDELSQGMIAFVREQRARQSTQRLDGFDEERGFALAYKIAAVTGWRHFRVEESADGDKPKVVALTGEALMSALHEGSLTDLVLEGVNACDDVFATSDMLPQQGSAPKRR